MDTKTEQQDRDAASDCADTTGPAPPAQQQNDVGEPEKLSKSWPITGLWTRRLEIDRGWNGVDGLPGTKKLTLELIFDGCFQLRVTLDKNQEPALTTSGAAEADDCEHDSPDVENVLEDPSVEAKDKPEPRFEAFIGDADVNPKLKYANHILFTRPANDRHRWPEALSEAWRDIGVSTETEEENREILDFAYELQRMQSRALAQCDRPDGTKLALLAAYTAYLDDH